MLSLPLQSLVGNSHVCKVRRLAAAVCVGCLVLSGCSSGSAEAEGADGTASGSPFAEPEDPTPKIPDYTVEEGLELSDDDKQLADEAVVFFAEYMAAANRAYKDGGVYWDKYIDMSTEDLKEANEQARDDNDASGFRAVNDLKYETPNVLDFGLGEDSVFVTACFDYRNWERVTNDGPFREKNEDDKPLMGLYVLKSDGVWKAKELSKESPSCDSE